MSEKSLYQYENALRIAGLACVYLALEWISSIHEYKGLPFTAWDPGLGLLFAVMIRMPVVAAVALFAGFLAAETFVLKSAPDVWRMSAMAAINTAVYYICAKWLTQRPGFNPALARLSDTVSLMIAGVTGAFVSGILLTGVLVLTGEFKLADMADASLRHIVGDSIGIAVIAPLALRLYSEGRSFRARALRDYWFELAILLATVLLYYTLAKDVPQAESHRYFYLLFVPVVLWSVRHGLTGASLALTLLQICLVIFLGRLEFDAYNFTAHQTMMLVLTATGLLVGAIVSERDAISQAAETARNRLAAMEQASMRAARFNLVNGMASTLAHELSQPLTAARARARLVEVNSERGDIAALREQVTSLITQIDAAAAILQRVREFIGRRETRRETTSWQVIATKTEELLSLRAREAGVRMVFSSEDSSLSLHCDAIQIEQVLVNLIGNAIDAIGIAQGEVRITAKRISASRQAEISVHDNGPGIAPDLQATIFEPLATTRRDGLGLGLAICALIVESHSGKLWLEASGPGSTEFRFTLPLGKGDDFK